MDLKLLLSTQPGGAFEEKRKSQVKSYFCEKCSTGFTAKGSLKVHLRTVHEGLRPYGCGECNKQFGTRNNLMRHQRIVHLNQKPYFCGACKQYFVTLSSVNRHISRKHKESSVS
ncbi:hypothetical protein NDN08_005569 [Rhodosorus marinus]|uniref:C2H2-type domain-containing protein n=1 Tax=Rhodosorus marinus TaxID=101924 RepID=A0AAV8V1Y7_9RHOD|nr:hypothetical protein NDN08_005569 [Rhodosorus marinus]